MQVLSFRDGWQHIWIVNILCGSEEEEMLAAGNCCLYISYSITFLHHLKIILVENDIEMIKYSYYIDMLM